MSNAAPKARSSRNLARLAKAAEAVPEAQRVDIEAWGEITFRVRKKVFLYTGPAGTTICLKLPLSEAEARLDSDESVTPMKFALGRHGWIEAQLHEDEDDGDRARSQ